MFTSSTEDFRGGGANKSEHGGKVQVEDFMFCIKKLLIIEEDVEE